MFVLYFCLWVIFNGTWTTEIAVIGLGVAAVIFWFTCKFMDYSLNKEKKLYISLWLLLQYAGILFWEIIQANLAAVRLILSEKEVVEPVLAHFTVDLKTQTGKTLLANAITLTPGTITVNIDGNHFAVHCLDKSIAVGMDSSSFVKVITKLENLWIKD